MIITITSGLPSASSDTISFSLSRRYRLPCPLIEFKFLAVSCEGGLDEGVRLLCAADSITSNLLSLRSEINKQNFNNVNHWELEKHLLIWIYKRFGQFLHQCLGLDNTYLNSGNSSETWAKVARAGAPLRIDRGWMCPLSSRDACLLPLGMLLAPLSSSRTSKVNRVSLRLPLGLPEPPLSNPLPLAPLPLLLPRLLACVAGSSAATSNCGTCSLKFLLTLCARALTSLVA